MRSKRFKNLIMRNVPKHYQNGKIYDLIDVIQDFKLNFNRGNVLKYVCRAGKKENEVEDIEKAIDYLQRELKYVKRNVKLKF
tara:strand:- start:381 stop:626 length:246 start_codon:yes stop_codon:yes gene_type:complete